MPQFRIAAELVRNGRIGKLHTVKIGLPGDPSGPEAPEMPVPKNLNYDDGLDQHRKFIILKYAFILRTASLIVRDGSGANSLEPV